MPSFLFVFEELCASSPKIVAVFKRISDECVIARPDAAFDPRENLLIKGQSIPAFHANRGSHSAHAPS
jgi:hypothetical protein